MSSGPMCQGASPLGPTCDEPTPGCADPVEAPAAAPDDPATDRACPDADVCIGAVWPGPALPVDCATSACELCALCLLLLCACAFACVSAKTTSRRRRQMRQQLNPVSASSLAGSGPVCVALALSHGDEGTPATRPPGAGNGGFSLCFVAVFARVSDFETNAGGLGSIGGAGGTVVAS